MCDFMPVVREISLRKWHLIRDPDEFRERTNALRRNNKRLSTSENARTVRGQCRKASFTRESGKRWQQSEENTSMQGLAGHDFYFGFYSKYDKFLESFKHRNNMISFLHWKGHSVCCMELQEGRSRNRSFFQEKDGRDLDLSTCIADVKSGWILD